VQLLISRILLLIPTPLHRALLPSLLLDGTGIKPEAFSVAKAITEGSITLPPTFIIHGR